MFWILITIFGCVLGRLAAGWSAAMLHGMNCGGLLTCRTCERPVSRLKRWLWPLPIRCACTSGRIVWHLGSTFSLGGLFLLFTWLLVDQRCQTVSEVQPSIDVLYARLPFHLSLIFLLWVATVTDFLDYVIPDEIIYLGLTVAIVAASATGQLQMIHIWVNWDHAIEGMQGPFLPQWMKDHQHLHGLAWSVGGLFCGAGITWCVRFLSHKILGYPALGFGDVTLMALIGAYLGWQPTLCVLAMAPLTGIVIGMFVRIATGRSFVAYGPYLACSAFLVMSSWRWLWADFFSLRDVFSHWPSVVGLVVFSFVTLIALLFMLRLFRTLPTQSLRR